MSRRERFVDPKKFYSLMCKIYSQLEGYFRSNFGFVKSIGKEVKGVANSEITSALTIVDNYVQETLFYAITSVFSGLECRGEESLSRRFHSNGNYKNNIVIADPLDGTKLYELGIKNYSSMVALLGNNEVLASFGAMPEVGLYLAMIKGQGVWEVDVHNKKSERVFLYDLNKVSVKGDSRHRVIGHYRAGVSPAGKLKRDLDNIGYHIDSLLGKRVTNLEAVTNFQKGFCVGMIGTYMAIHDWIVPVSMLQELGAKVMFYDVERETQVDFMPRLKNPDFMKSWENDVSPRFRLVVGRNQSTLDRLVKALE